jgi:hypothetical protein
MISIGALAVPATHKLSNNSIIVKIVPKISEKPMPLFSDSHCENAFDFLRGVSCIFDPSSK